MRLLLARHGVAQGQGGQYLGATDRAISEEGHAQAVVLAGVVEQYKPESCFCSPLVRARQTTEVALGRTDIDYVIHDSLREINFGRWEGMTFPEICDQDPGLVKQWQADISSFQFPEGEHNAHFQQRVGEIFNQICQRSDETVLVISHGGVIRFMICMALGLDLNNYLLFNVKPGKIALLEMFGSKGVLSGLNI